MLHVLETLETINTTAGRTEKNKESGDGAKELLACQGQVRGPQVGLAPLGDTTATLKVKYQCQG